MHPLMSAKNPSLTLSYTSGLEIADSRLDPLRGQKRQRQGDVCSAEKQEQEQRQLRRQLW
jgi:uncharacterized protein involved in exopolysaccharide biosynthesis